MAKFSSDFTRDAATGFSIQGGVTGATASPLSGLGNMIKGVGAAFDYDAAKTKADRIAAEKAQEKADKVALGGMVLEGLNLEEETAQFNAKLAGLEERMLTEKDQGTLNALNQEYGRLVRAQSVGANPSTIKARQRALQRKFIAENPHLAKEAMSMFQEVDGFVGLADTGNTADNAVVKAQSEMLARAQSGISIPMQMQLAQQQFEADSLKTQVDISTANGKLAFPQLYALASADSRQLATEVNDLVASIIDPNSPEFQGVDAATAKMLLNQNMEQMVSQKIQYYVASAAEAGMTLTGDQLSSIEKQIRGNVMATVEPYVQAMDSKDWLDRTNSILSSKVEIANNTSVLEFQRNEPAMHRMQQIFGKEQAYSIAKSGARLSQILGDQARAANLPTLLQSDPDLAFAYQVLQDQGIFSFMEQKLSDPARVVGSNPKLDAMATAGNIEAMNDGALNPQGEVAVLSSVMYGSSLNNTYRLMNDKYYNRLRVDEDSQKALRNFTANEVENVFGPMMDTIANSGYDITFTPVPATRRKDGKSYLPAEAFVATDPSGKGVSADIQKHIQKLNALYTLHGAFSDEATLQSLGERLAGYVDPTNPQFIERHSAEQINILTEKRKYWQEKLDRGLERKAAGQGAGSIYDSPEERVANLDNSIMANEAEIASIDLAIEAQRMRNPSYQLGLPAGTVLDQEASKAAGKSVYRLPDGTLVEAE